MRAKPLLLAYDARASQSEHYTLMLMLDASHPRHLNSIRTLHNMTLFPVIGG